MNHYVFAEVCYFLSSDYSPVIIQFFKCLRHNEGCGRLATKCPNWLESYWHLSDSKSNVQVKPMRTKLLRLSVRYWFSQRRILQLSKQTDKANN